MTYTENWKAIDYQNYVIKNKLDLIWAGWCNPSTGGVRVAAYKPIYEDWYAKWHDAGNKKCTKKRCNGILVIPDEDKRRRITNILRCNVCSTKKDIMYRDVEKRGLDGKKKPKLHFPNPEAVRYYAKLGRTFYSTLTVYNKQILNPDEDYVDVKLMNSSTLGVDIDIKYGCITDQRNREELQNVINYLRKEFLDIVPNSYNLQTSGNGVYILIHHGIVNKNIEHTGALFNAWIAKMNEKVENDYVKIDALNAPSRVFKLMGSIHQQHDLVAIPLEHDVDLTKMNPDQFKVKNFNIYDYIDDTGKLKYYNRCNIDDSITLYHYLENNIALLPTSSPRAMKAAFREEEDESKWAEHCEEHMKKEAWISLNSNETDIPGEVYYRRKNGNLEINLFRVREEDRDKIKRIIKQKILLEKV